jgi:Tn3 transposase DDE domain-containing protein
MIDGIVFAECCCVAALVVTADGTKVPVGLWEGDTENTTVVTDLAAECEPLISGYCRELGLPATASSFVDGLRTHLTDTASEVDRDYPRNNELVISERGEPMLKAKVRSEPRPGAQAVESALLERLPERSLIDALCNAEHWVNWTRHLGPLSGSDPKIDRAVERYVLSAFTYGCNLGAAQAARHMHGLVTPHMLSFVNRRHVAWDS